MNEKNKSVALSSIAYIKFNGQMKIKRAGSLIEQFHAQLNIFLKYINYDRSTEKSIHEKLRLFKKLKFSLAHPTKLV